MRGQDWGGDRGAWRDDIMGQVNAGCMSMMMLKHRSCVVMLFCVCHVLNIHENSQKWSTALQVLRSSLRGKTQEAVTAL